MIGLLGFIARHGRWCLVLGLFAGFLLPELASALRPWLAYLIAALLCLAALRIGPQAVLQGLRSDGRSMRIVLLYQLILPILALSLVSILGVASAPWALALVFVLSAPSVTGSPNFAILMGRDPKAAMHLLLIGTALFPVTVLPVLWFGPAIQTPVAVVESALRLVGVIFGVVAFAFACRRWVWRRMTIKARAAIDGASALLLGVVVVGLMSAAGPALINTPSRFFAWLAFACALNFGLQILSARLMPLAHEQDRPGVALVAGNRNVALFLVALPPETIDSLLLFIGVYQVPMYLTPLLMRRVTGPRTTKQI